MEPNQPSPEPIAATAVPSPSAEARPASPAPVLAPYPPQIIIQTSQGPLVRVLLWLGWAGFAFSSFFALVLMISSLSYTDTGGNVKEKYHSLSKSARDKVAVISVEGVIMDGRLAKHQIDRVKEDERVKAVVLRVDSPGGTVTGSDYILHHLKELKKERDIPIVVSMGSIAASGGYYVSMAVEDQEKAIYAEPTTTTGSIGVIIPHYDISGLLQRFDVKDDSIVSHPRKQMLAMTKPMPEEHREIVQKYLNATFERFKGIVKDGRPKFRKDDEALAKVATGEIFTAEQAKAEGLVDEIGFIEDAIDRAIALAGLDKKKVMVVKYEGLPTSLLELLGESRAPKPADATALLQELSTPKAYYLATQLPGLTTANP